MAAMHVIIGQLNTTSTTTERTNMFRSASTWMSSMWSACGSVVWRAVNPFAVDLSMKGAR
jgi:hypothetical protein